MKANQRKMATNEWYFTLNGVFLEDFSALSTCILSGDEVNDLERILGQDGEIGLATTRINYFGWISLSWFHIEEKPTTPLDGRRSQECGAASLACGEESLLGTGGNCWRIDRSQQSPTRLQNPPTANSFLIRGKAVDTLESIFRVISNTFMCLNSLIGTSSQPTSKTRALPTPAFRSERKSYQCSQSRLLGILRQIFIRDIK